MRKAPLPSVKTEIAEIPVAALKKYIQNWLMACEMSTLANRRIYVSKLLWFLAQRELDSCGVHELRAFFAYIKNGHTEVGGR